MGKRGPSKEMGSKRSQDGLQPIGTIPDPPETLKGKGLDEWGRICSLLSSRGILSSEDWASVLVYCQAIQMNDEAAKIVSEEGMICMNEKNNAPYQHPAVGIMNKTAEMVVRLSARLGLSPADRASIKQPEKQENLGKEKFFKTVG